MLCQQQTAQSSAAHGWILGLAVGLLLFQGGCVSLEPTALTAPPPLVAVTPGLEPKVRGWVEVYRSQVGVPPFDLDVMPLEAAQDRLRRGEVALAFTAASPPDGWFATPVGEERIAVVVNPDNRVRGFDLRQLERLFSGEYVSWADVQGEEASVQVYIPFPGDDLRAVFAQTTLRGRRMSPNARLYLTPAKAVTMVADDQDGLAILPLSALTSDVRAVRVEGALPDDAGSSYPYQVDILATAPSEPTGALREFLSWLQASNLP